jgi:hypothetical protein
MQFVKEPTAAGAVSDRSVMQQYECSHDAAVAIGVEITRAGSWL